MQLGGLFYAAKLLRFVDVPVAGVLGLVVLLYRPREAEHETADAATAADRPA
jgi:hypothetical protein